MTEKEIQDIERKNLFSSNLRQFRKQSDFTQADLADELEVDPRTIQRWEKAKSIPNHKHLKAMADLFGVSIDDLFLINIKQQTSRKAVGKSKVVKDFAPAIRVKTDREKFAEKVLGMAEFLTRDL